MKFFSAFPNLYGKKTVRPLQTASLDGIFTRGENKDARNPSVNENKPDSESSDKKANTAAYLKFVKSHENTDLKSPTNQTVRIFTAGIIMNCSVLKKKSAISLIQKAKFQVNIKVFGIIQQGSEKVLVFHRQRLFMLYL